MKIIARSDSLPFPGLWRAWRPVRAAAHRLHLPVHRANPHSVAELSDHLRRDIGRERMRADFGDTDSPAPQPH